MKEDTRKQILRLILMALIGVSVMLIKVIGLWFLIPWVIFWTLYDDNLTQ